MKMSDVFDLPLVDDDLWHCIQDDKYGEKEEAAAHAINMHDELVDVLQLMRETFENAGNVVDHDYAIAMATADELLTRAKGAE